MKLLDEGVSKESVDDPKIKGLMELLYFKGVRSLNYVLEHASIRRRFSGSYNVVKENPKNSFSYFSVNVM